MKKVKIDFDFSKWGQEGISVHSIQFDLCTYQMITLHKHPIHNDVFYGVDNEGDTIDGVKEYFTMYQEVKPREVYINEFDNGLSDCNYFSLTLQGALDSRGLTGYKRTIKFREVLDDEQ